MKRNKIKPKYLNKFLQSTNEITPKETHNIFDKTEKTILKSLASFGLIILLLTWNYIPITILAILGIDYTTFSEIGKIICMIISDILLLIILFNIYKKSIIQDFKNFFNNNLKENFKISFRYWAIGMIIMLISNYIILIINNGEIAANEQAVQNLIKIAPWYMVFELLIFAPISEELVFRRSIRDIVKNPYIYALISGLIFGGLHAISSLNSMIDLLYLIPYCSLGIAFALLYSKTNNIFSTITIHAFHNGLALLLYFL